MGEPRTSEDAPAIFLAITRALREHLDQVRPDVVVREIPAPSRIAPYAFALAGELAGDSGDTASGRLILLFDPDGQDAWEGLVRIVCYARASIEPELADDPLLPGVAWSWLTESLESRNAATRALGGTVTTTSSRRFGVLATDGDGLDTDTFDVELRCSWSPDWVETAMTPTRRSARRGAAVPLPLGPAGRANRGGRRLGDPPSGQQRRSRQRQPGQSAQPGQSVRPAQAGGAEGWSAAATAAHLHAFADLLATMAGLPPILSGVVPLPAHRG